MRKLSGRSDEANERGEGVECGDKQWVEEW